MDPVEIDGSILEGGGQILRISISLSALFKRPVRVFNIRAGRPKGGLSPQHLKGLHLATEMCCGDLKGGEIESKAIVFRPKKIIAGNFYADAQTAGSVSLILQVVLPISLFAPSLTILNLRGGTNADMAPPIDHTIHVLQPVLQKFGAHFDCKVLKRGYYPLGGGDVIVNVIPVTRLMGASFLEFGTLTRVWGKAYVAGNLPMRMCEEAAECAEKLLRAQLLSTTRVEIKRKKESTDDAFGNGCGIVLFAETSTGCILGASSISSRNKSPFQAGKQAAESLLADIRRQVCVDSHTQDQIILYMAIARGYSRVKCGPITLHTKTAIYVANLVLGVNFRITDCGNDTNMIECEGMCVENHIPSQYR